MKLKTICFISPKFSDFIGGMETHAVEFVNFFSKKKGYKIKAIITKKIVDDGIPVPNKKIDSKLNKLIKPILDGNFKEDAKKILEQSNPLEDIYYLNSPTWLPALVLLKREYPTLRIFVRSGGNDIVAGWMGSEVNLKNNLEDQRTYMVSLINDYIEKFIVNSEYSYKRTISVGVKPEKLIKIIGGVDCDKFKPLIKKINSKKRKEIIELVTSARLVKFKGFEYNLMAIQEVISKSKVEIRYTILGEGPERINIEHLINQLKISDNVRLIGGVSLEDVPVNLNNKNIFIHLPIYLEKIERGSKYIHTETMGRCLCEASACGLPVIASNVGGVPEIIRNNITGFIVNEKDYHAAAEKIMLLINNPLLIKKMSKNARKTAKELFDFKKIFKIYEKLF